LVGLPCLIIFVSGENCFSINVSLQFSSICVNVSLCSSIIEFLCISKLVNNEFLLVASWRHSRWMILRASIFIFKHSGPWRS
jgi:hypothetical protein